MRHDLILLDLDGTLMDSAAGIISSIRHTYVTLGVPAPPDDELRRFVGPPITESFLAHGFTPESLPEAMRVYRADFAARGMHANRVFDGIEETLTAQNLSDTFGMPIALSVEDGRYAARATSGA